MPGDGLVGGAAEPTCQLRHHPPGRRRGLRRLCPARLARPLDQRPDSRISQVVGDLLLRARASRLPPDGLGRRECCV